MNNPKVYITLIVLVCLLGMGGCVYIVVQDEKSDAKHDRDVTHKINTICADGKPIAFEAHNASWSFGGYWEVTCKDGTKRIVDA